MPADDAIPFSPAQKALFQRLNALGLSYETVQHRPVFTVEEGRDIKARLPGGHTKNLFLKDKAGAIALVCAISATRVDLKAMGKAFAKGRWSFASEALMREAMGVSPGSVTPFALINDKDARLAVYFDQALFAYDRVWFHPLENTASTAIAPDDLLKFAASCGHKPVVIDPAAPGPPVAPRPG